MSTRGDMQIRPLLSLSSTNVRPTLPTRSRLASLLRLVLAAAASWVHIPDASAFTSFLRSKPQTEALCQAPCVSFVFLVGPGHSGFPAKPAWTRFFESCPQPRTWRALVFEHRQPYDLGNPHCKSVPWAQCGAYAYPRQSLRWSTGMVRGFDGGMYASVCVCVCIRVFVMNGAGGTGGSSGGKQPIATLIRERYSADDQEVQM